MKRTNQGGSIGGFIIIGVVLAVLFIGGVYTLKSYVVSQHDGDEVALKESGSSERQAGVSESNPSDQKERTSNGSAGEDKDGYSEAVGEGDSSSTRQDDVDSAVISGQGSDSTHSATDSSGYDGGLPETGPADAAGGAIAVFFLAIATFTYLQSRRSSVYL